MAKFKSTLKRNFITGLIAILPLWLTLYISWFFLNWIGGLFGRLLKQLPLLQNLPYVIHIFLGFLVVVLLIFIIGVVTSNIVGRRLLALGESILRRVPLIRTIYAATRQLTDTFLIAKSAFRKVVMIEFPRPGTYAIGFLTSEAKWKMKGDNKKYAVNVFVPSTPNPTTGWLIMVPEEELISTNLSVEWGIKMVVSGGIVSPELCEMARREES